MMGNVLQRENNVGKGENAGHQHFCPFLTMLFKHDAVQHRI